MKVLISFAIFFTIVNSQTLTWEDYKAKFDKSYGSMEDYQRRGYFNFQQVNEITPHNRQYDAGTQTFNLDYNVLTDFGFAYNFNTAFKLISWATDFSNFPKGVAVEVTTSDLPTSFELDTSRVLVMDQTNNGNWNYMKCNYGWAFAVAKAIEIFGINNSKNPSTVSLSPQQLIDCWSGDNCSKGIPHKALEYLVNFNQALYSEESYNYVGQKRDFCSTDISSYPSAGSLRRFSTLADNATEDQIKGVLVNIKAPVIFELDPYNEKFINYKSGVYNIQTPTNYHSHFLVIVGFGTETIKGENYPYWKVLNSWGTTWGEGGYMKLLRARAPLKKFVFPSKL